MRAARNLGRFTAQYALCDPDDPTFADACKVYERFNACYASALGLAKAGSTFPIPDSPDSVATGLAGSLGDGMASSADIGIQNAGLTLQRFLGALTVFEIARSLIDAYYACS